MATKLKNPEVQLYPVEADPRQIERTKRIAERVWEAIERQIFYALCFRVSWPNRSSPSRTAQLPAGESGRGVGDPRVWGGRVERGGWVGSGRRCDRGRGSEIGSRSSSRGMAIAHEAENGTRNPTSLGASPLNPKHLGLVVHSLRLCLPGHGSSLALRCGLHPAPLTHLACRLSAGTRAARRPRPAASPGRSRRFADRQPHAGWNQPPPRSTRTEPLQHPSDRPRATP